jgi:hypothetical protein
MVERYGGTETTVIDWHARLVRAGCGGRQIDFVATGTERHLARSDNLSAHMKTLWLRGTIT